MERSLDYGKFEINSAISVFCGADLLCKEAWTTENLILIVQFPYFAELTCYGKKSRLRKI
jgi:hypothetical protein